MTTPILDTVIQYPSVVIANPQTAPLFADLPNLEKIIIMQRQPWQKHWLQAWNQTRGRTWQNILDFRRAGLPHLLRAHRKFIWQDNPTSPLHIVAQVSQAFGASTHLSPKVWISEERQRKWQQTRPTFAVSPIPAWKGKQWPLEKFSALLMRFCKTYPDAQVAVFTAPHERHLIGDLLAVLPEDQCVNTEGMSLLDSAALIKNSRLYIGNDSGLTHLSAAVDTPSIALFGPSNENIYGPWSAAADSPHRTIRGEPFSGNVRQVASDTNCYMTALDVNPVWDVVQERWEALSKR